ncbi:iron-sulfur cluster co-chaperone protein HscB homolog [Magnolia sinica]|uniref:iron-sulfur cluster co-chaperone protein HscB homolog n=1 Tax=Magnolia sinica TaxID=86752 RepID=UPI002659F707|nr:iron-sulfur cluster co-chaperone protein HscB homolog [Magnolia sinica]XP_058084675.1 iron-sulfur cluster co-chaperone protein HscB homolog [Magnolia sinica]
MSKNRNLLIYTLRSLHRTKSPTNQLFFFDYHPKPQISRFLSLPSHPSTEPRGLDLLSSDSRFSSRNFCSKSGKEGVDKCWNCGTAPPAALAPFLSCGSCGSVQPVDRSVDYFQIFGLEKRYDVPGENLDSKYKNWQKKLHPDLVHSKSEEERTYAAEQSARVIDAYRTLSKPLSRALYLLKLEGVHVDEEKTVSDPELLTEIMEIREAVDDADDSEALKQIQSQIQSKLVIWSDSFGTAFKNREFDHAVTSTQRMTYYERALEEIVKKL